MGRHMWVEDDEFAMAFSEVLGDIATASEDALFNCVHDALVEGRDDWRRRTKAYSAKYHEGSWKYGEHVTYRTLRKKGLVEGHIFSRKPGLPHLLEKGHAKIGGGRTQAYEHVKPASELAFEYVRRLLPEYIARELR